MSWNLTWSDIEDYLLTSEERHLLKGSYTFEDIDYEMRRSRESELLRYRLWSGLLDINRIESTLFEQQFRFQKDDLDKLAGALLMPEVFVRAQRHHAGLRRAMLNPSPPGLPKQVVPPLEYF